MGLIKAQCTNCGAILDVDNAKDAAICPYCNTPYIVEKAINNYVTNISNNINAQTVIINGQYYGDFEIIAGKLVAYKGSSNEIVVPECVTIIDPEAFRNCEGVTKVKIPKSVTQLYGTFSGMIRLTDVDIPNTVTTIGRFTFEDCVSLRSFVIPLGVRIIGDFAFSNCKRLSSINIPGSVEYIGEFAFSDCVGLERIVIPDSMIEIAEKAFYGCVNIKEFVLPKHLDYSYYYLFGYDFNDDLKFTYK